MDPVADPMADRAPSVAVARGVGPTLPVAMAQIQARLGLGTGFFFFLFFYLINRSRQTTASVVRVLTGTFCSRQLHCPPRIIQNGCLG
jgi:hypothetical protein